jgi:subtilase family serine protease
VSVGGTTLQTGSTNSIPASPPPTFVANITNSGQNNETNVVIKVEVSGTSITGQTTIPQTTAGQSTSANVTLPTSPPKGNYTVKLTVEPVPGEKNVSNNSLSFPVTFQ